MRLVGYIFGAVVTLIWFLITYMYFTSSVYQYSIFWSTIAWPSILLLLGIFAFWYFWGRVFCSHNFSFSNDSETEANAQVYDFSKVAEPKHSSDDLKIIEWVGPKLEQLLQKNQLSSFSAIAKTSVDDLQKIIESAGNKFAMHNPKTWPEQAKLAQQGKWEELKEYQNFLYRWLDS